MLAGRNGVNGGRKGAYETIDGFRLRSECVRPEDEMPHPLIDTLVRAHGSFCERPFGKIQRRGYHYCPTQAQRLEMYRMSLLGYEYEQISKLTGVNTRTARGCYIWARRRITLELK